jgi:RecF/RecN/SMC N terminal domain
MQNNKWIKKERDNLGVAGGKYDFAALDMEAKQAEFAQADRDAKELTARVNRKVLTEFEHADKECKSLLERREIVRKDRDSIVKVRGIAALKPCACLVCCTARVQMLNSYQCKCTYTLAGHHVAHDISLLGFDASETASHISHLQSIEELDGKRLEFMQRAWRDVNKSFNEIFTTLLPGTSAKLVTPNDGPIEDGLEFKVAFGDVWKESLSELSGGQRSLVALSLVFALLKFRPAPLYILDEVRPCLLLRVANKVQCTAALHLYFISHDCHRCFLAAGCTHVTVCACGQLQVG